MVFLKGPHILIGIILNYGEYHCVLERSHVLICLVSMVQIFGLWCWLVWKERNRCTFEDMESSLDQLKTLFAHTLFNWSWVWGFTQYSSILEFQVSLRFFFWDCCTFWSFVFIFVNIKYIWFSIKLITYEKKKKEYWSFHSGQILGNYMLNWVKVKKRESSKIHL